MTYSAWAGIDGGAGPRMAGAHQRERHFQVALAAAQLAPQQHELLGGDQIEVLEGHADGDVARRRIGIELAQLQGDALAEIARAHAGGLEGLNCREHPFHVRGRSLDLGPQAQANVLQVVVQIAVIGNGIGDHARDREVDRRELGELELLDELLLQGLAVLVAEVAAAVVIARPGRYPTAPLVRSPHASSAISTSGSSR